MYQAAWTKTPVLRLVGSRMTSLTNDVVTVMGFSNVGPVTLAVNGRDLGTRAPDAACGVLWPDVRLRGGDNRVELRAGGRTSCATWTVEKR